ncbi:type VI secretion system baseplate subunit TssK, partial [Acinetobacter baumannii]
RYQSHLVETDDLFSNATEANISLLRRRAVFKLLDAHSNPDHNLDGFLYLPIGKIKRQSSDAFEIDRKFIPPILHVDASEALVSNL